jgi:hypothetical protein
MNGTTVLLTAIGYVSFLFLIAWWGDGAGRRFLSGRSRAFVYALSLAVYCTSWTYYGSVGLASAHGLDFLPIYIGPILVIGFGAPFIARIANLARAERLHGRRFRIRAIWKITTGRGSRRAHRVDRVGALCGAPAQGRRANNIDGGEFVRSRAIDAGDTLGLVLSRGVVAARHLRDGVRDQAHQP